MYFTFLATMTIDVLSTHDKQPREDVFFGAWVKKGKQNLFYKAPPALIDVGFLESHLVIRDLNERAYFTDVRETPRPEFTQENLDEWKRI
jgi:hypothetical protein